MDDKKLLALARKNAARTIAKQKKATPKYDATLPEQPVEQLENTEELKHFFKEMKRREF